MKMTDILKNMCFRTFLILYIPLVLCQGWRSGAWLGLPGGADASQSWGWRMVLLWPFRLLCPAAVDWLIGLIGAAVVRLVVYVKENAKKYRKDVCGIPRSARWGTKAILLPLWTLSRKITSF